MIAQPPAPPPVVAPALPTVQVSVRPDTVTVGEPFTLVIAVETAPGTLVRFPAEPDSARTVGLRTPAAIPDAGDRLPNGRQRWSARYALAAWDVGTVGIPIGPITVGNRPVPVFAQVVVRSVLPADTAQRVPQPARGPVAWPAPWWLPWVIGAVVAALLGALAAAIARWRRRRPLPRVRAIDTARAAVAALDVDRWLAAGEHVHLADASGQLLRRYLRTRWAETALLEGSTLEPGLTTAELAARLAEVGWPAHARARTLLERVDAARFAPAPLAAADARTLATAVGPLVEEMEDALRTREAAGAAPPARAA